MELKKISDHIFEIPKEGKMNVPARIFASEKLLERINQLTEIFSEAPVLHEEIARSLRLLDAARRYLKIKDERVLLELPVEERDLLKPLLAEGEETPQAEIAASKRPRKRQTPSRSRRRKRAVSPTKQTG